MAYCIEPYRKEGSEISFPCGKCFDCRKRRAASWGFRLSQQCQISDTAYFITLTYNTENLHFALKARRPTLNKRDVQLFIKRLRKQHPGQKLKYYLAAEYGGTKKMRPHYHLIIFNMQLTTLLGEQTARRTLKVPTLYLDGKFEYNIKLWDKGHITIGTVTNASSMYTLKYLSKPKRVPQYKRDDREPEFSLISKNIGKNYTDSQQIKDWHRADPNERMFVHFQNYKIAMPRYYKEQIYTAEEREQIAEHIIEKQKTERIKQRKTEKLKDRIKYINNILAIKVDKKRQQNKITEFKPKLL